MLRLIWIRRITGIKPRHNFYVDLTGIAMAPQSTILAGLISVGHPILKQ